jgi:hypothetical protein
MIFSRGASEFFKKVLDKRDCKWYNRFIKRKRGKNMRHEVTVIKETKKKLFLISNEPIAKTCSFARALEAVKSFKEALISEGYPVLDVFIPSEFEIFGSWIYGVEDNEPYKPFKFFRTRENRITFLSDCWLRSPRCYNYDGFRYVRSDGGGGGSAQYVECLNVNPIIILDKTKH